MNPELRSRSAETEKPKSEIAAAVHQIVSYSAKKEKSLLRDLVIIPKLKFHSPKIEETIL
jgi:hypothetical protein